MHIARALLLEQRQTRPALDWDFTLDTLPSELTLTRADAGYAFNQSGQLTSYAADVARFDHEIGGSTKYGLLLEGARTNLCLQARDQTNASWTKSNCSTAKDQTGIDGAANSACKLTASAANGTCLQTITATGGNKCLSLYIRRVTGTGGIDITLDGGTTWVPVTITGAWQRFYTVQGLLNPSAGIRIQTSGDAIAVDCAQLEHNVVMPSSPMPTTTASVTRGADAVSATLTSDIYQAPEFTLYTKFRMPFYAASSATYCASCLDDASVSNHCRIGLDSSGVRQAFMNSAAATQVNSGAGSAVASGAIIKIATRMRANDFWTAFDGLASVRDTSGTLPAFTTLRLGSRSDGSQNLFGTIMHLKLYKVGLTDQQVQNLVA